MLRDPRVIAVIVLLAYLLIVLAITGDLSVFAGQ